MLTYITEGLQNYCPTSFVFKKWGQSDVDPKGLKGILRLSYSSKLQPFSKHKKYTVNITIAHQKLFKSRLTNHAKHFYHKIGNKMHIVNRSRGTLFCVGTL